MASTNNPMPAKTLPKLTFPVTVATPATTKITPAIKSTGLKTMPLLFITLKKASLPFILFAKINDIFKTPLKSVTVHHQNTVISFLQENPHYHKNSSKNVRLKHPMEGKRRVLLLLPKKQGHLL